MPLGLEWMIYLYLNSIGSFGWNELPAITVPFLLAANLPGLILIPAIIFGELNRQFGFAPKPSKNSGGSGLVTTVVIAYFMFFMCLALAQNVDGSAMNFSHIPRKSYSFFIWLVSCIGISFIGFDEFSPGMLSQTIFLSAMEFLVVALIYPYKLFSGKYGQSNILSGLWLIIVAASVLLFWVAIASFISLLIIALVAPAFGELSGAVESIQAREYGPGISRSAPLAIFGGLFIILGLPIFLFYILLYLPVKFALHALQQRQEELVRIN